MTTTPDVRSGDPGRIAADCRCGTSRVITAEQLDQAVLQLRERRGRPAAEQMQAVLRALDLTVAPRDECGT